ncbi:MAG: cobamide remodeling phosphodiesterase CbiR, partial [Anaerolineae bacterium]|nr:cobamide remodeling phosphodiesterase CbiR [Anaerolineae bacterium]
QFSFLFRIQEPSMRFGVMTIQLSEIIPQDNNPALIQRGMQSFNHAAIVRKLWSLGFNPVELSGDLGMFFAQAFNPQAVRELAELKDEVPVSYTLHCPLWSVEPSTPLGPVRQGSIQAVIDNILAVKPLEPEAYVFHATGALAAEFYRMQLPEMARGFLLRQFQIGATHSLETILQATGIDSRKLAIETIEFPLDLTLEMAEQFDLSLCLDVGHILSGFSGPLDFWEVVERCLPRVAEVHLHDAVYAASRGEVVYGQDHQVLGTRDLDTGRFLDLLAAAGYSGPIILEMPVQQALISIAEIRRLRPAYVAA